MQATINKDVLFIFRNVQDMKKLTGNSCPAGQAVFCGLGSGLRRNRKNLKKLYAELEEPAGWGELEVAKLREERWDRVLC
jgi:hypothetical protein